MYSNMYRATPLSNQDNLTTLLCSEIPAYTPLMEKKTKPPSTQAIRAWPDDAFLKVQECFDLTDWSMFKQLNLETFTLYIPVKACAD